jgi:hypothetical protein
LLDNFERMLLQRIILYVLPIVAIVALRWVRGWQLRLKSHFGHFYVFASHSLLFYDADPNARQHFFGGVQKVMMTVGIVLVLVFIMQEVVVLVILVITAVTRVVICTIMTRHDSARTSHGRG